MQVSVEKVSKVERRLTITVPANEIEEAISKQINEIAKKADIKGFRPGKAPKSYIEQRFGDNARREAINDVIQKSFYEAITSEKLQPVSQPRIEPKPMLANQPLEYIASFEVMPDIEQVKFTADALDKLNVEITSQDIQHVLGQLVKQYTKWNLVERPAEGNDRVVIDYYAIFEGKSDIENKIKSFPLELGSKVMLAGFEDALLGVKAGDERSIQLAFPDDFAIKERAGKPVEFKVEVKQVYQAEAPILDEEFIKKLGIKSGVQDDLTAQIKQSLEQERDRLVAERLKEQVFGKLLEQNPLDVPAALIAREAKSIHDEVYPQHQHHDHHSHADEELTKFNDIAKKRVSLGLLIAEYARLNEIQVDQERVSKRIQEVASVYESPEEVVKWLSTREQRGGIEAQILEDQVIDKLVEGVKMTEKTMSYADLKGIRI